MKDSVARIPRAIGRMQEAEKIVNRWCEIQEELTPALRVKEFATLRADLTKFKNRYHRSANTTDL